MNKQSQTFTLDYIIGMSLFLIGLIASLQLIVNTFPDSTSETMEHQAIAMSEDLIGEGYPGNWTNDTVFRIGLLTNGSFDDFKYDYLHKLNYTSTLSMFNTPYEYYLFFEDNNGSLLTINGECGYGSEKVNVTKTYAFAYLFNEVGYPGYDNMFLEKMEHKYNETLYYKNSVSGTPIPAPIGTKFPGTLSGGLGEFIQYLDHGYYDLAFLEDAHMSDNFGGIGQTYENISGKLENWTAAGNTLYIIQHLRAKRVFNTYFNTSNWEGKNPTRIIAEDVSLPFHLNDSFYFNQTPQPFTSAENLTNYVIIGNYSDGNISIIKFYWGTGTVFFFSGLVANYSGKNNLSDEVDYSIDINGRRCQQISLNNIKYKNLQKVERILPYHSRLIKMVLYLWEEDRD